MNKVPDPTGASGRMGQYHPRKACVVATSMVNDSRLLPLGYYGVAE